MNKCGSCRVCYDHPVKQCQWFRTDLPIELRPDYLGAMCYIDTLRPVRVCIVESELGSFDMNKLTSFQQNFFAMMLKKANNFGTNLIIKRAA